MAATAGARMRTTALVNLAMVVEQANEQVLPAVYLFVGRSLNATPVQLGTLTLCRAMVQTLASPLSGILGDRYDRVLVLSSGAFIWGIMTSAMALTVTLHQAMAFAAFNGVGLALLVPCCQSLIADLHAPEQRGRAFGTLQLTASLGGMLGGVFATNMGATRPAGMDGWRAAFHSIAALSLVVGALALFFAVDPRRQQALQYNLLPDRDVSALLGDSAAAGAAGAGGGNSAAGGSSSPAPPSADCLVDVVPTSGTALLFRGPHAATAVAINGKGRSSAGEQLLAPHGRGIDQQQRHAPAHTHHQQQHCHPQQHHPQHQHGSRSSPARQHPGGGSAGGGGSSSSSSNPRDQASCKGKAAVLHDGDVDVRGREKGRKRGIVADICWMLRIRTFQAIVLQGIVGCFPWQAMVFFTLWLQLNGFSNATASLLVATFGAGVAGGALLGGSVGDAMARRLPNSGRIFTAQFSVACGIPLTWLLLKGLPASGWAAQASAYGCVMFVMGLTCTWAGAGCNSPIFAEIVPDELRSTIYAFDRSFENSIAACAAPVVGIMAERIFGFSGTLSDAALSDKVLRARNASALGSSLLACMVLPWSLCLVFYSLLHWFYPRDRQRALLDYPRTWAGGSGEGGAALYHH